MKTINYLSERTRIVTIAGEPHLESLRNGRWIKLFTPAPRTLPKGVSIVGGAS